VVIFQCLDISSGALLGDKKERMNWDEITTTVDSVSKSQRVELISDKNSFSLEKVRKKKIFDVF